MNTDLNCKTCQNSNVEVIKTDTERDKVRQKTITKSIENKNFP